jgi:phospholipid/cholesterol/gamma-HCH transport system substrate-binding protein
METHARYIAVGLFTVIVAVACFFFVYWLNSAAGRGAVTLYRVRFETPVIGLRPGLSVLFNGLRVGEVQRVQFDRRDPRLLVALIEVDSVTPVREDTRVGVEAQGLMGAMTVSLTGGSSESAALKPTSSGEPPLLVADPSASASLTQSAREALNKLDALLGDNASGVRDLIANLDMFSQALGRNAGRVDTILAGLEKMVSPAGPKAPPATFDLAIPQFPAPQKPVTAQVAVREPTALVVFDTQRVLVSSAPEQRQPLEQGQWADSLPKLVQAKVTESLEAAGFQDIAKSTDGFSAEAQILLDIRAFEVSLAPERSAHVTIAAKILNADGKMVGARTFSAEVPASGIDAEATTAALGEAFRKVAYDFAIWARETI